MVALSGLALGSAPAHARTVTDWPQVQVYSPSKVDAHVGWLAQAMFDLKRPAPDPGRRHDVRRAVEQRDDHARDDERDAQGDQGALARESVADLLGPCAERVRAQPLHGRGPAVP